MIEMFKDGDKMAIRTDAGTEDQFLREASAVLDKMIAEMRFNGLVDKDGEPHELPEYTQIASDWTFQFDVWLPQIVDICCKYRGYKAPQVTSHIVMTAGKAGLDDPMASYRENGTTLTQVCADGSVKDQTEELALESALASPQPRMYILAGCFLDSLVIRSIVDTATDLLREGEYETKALLNKLSGDACALVTRLDAEGAVKKHHDKQFLDCVGRLREKGSGLAAGLLSRDRDAVEKSKAKIIASQKRGKIRGRSS